MKYLLSFLLIVFSFTGIAQTTYPTGNPSPGADSGYGKWGYVRPMVLGHTVIGDTMIRPKYNGATRLWFNTGVDTAFWAWKDTRWVKVSSSGGGGGAGGGIDTIYYRTGPAIDSFFYVKDGTEYLWYVNPAPDGVIYGGVVTWTGTGLDYFVTECYFRKNGIYYLTNDTTVTLPPLADVDSSRTDVFIAQVLSDTQGQITTITGVESANPITPQINGATDLRLTDITLIPGQTTGLTDTLIVYDNLSGGEFEYRSGTGVTVTFNNTTNVWRIPYSADVAAINNNDIIGFGTETPRNALDYEGLSFFIKLKATMPNSNGMLVSLYSNGVPVGQEVGIPFNRTDLNYQGFSIPISSFQLTSAVFDSVRFRYTGGGAGISGMYIDFVYFQSGILQPATGVVQLVGDVTGSGQLGTPIVTTLESVISAGSCTNCDITYDSKGRILVASNGSGGSGITSLTTDVVATGPGAAVATIQPNVVTYPKMQQMVGLSVLGRANNTTGNMDAITPSAKSILITNMATTAWGNPDSSYLASGFHTQGYYDARYEPYLGLPAVNGYVLSSTTAGVRSWIPAGSGTVTSVGLTMPSAFNVANSPITTSGTLAVTGAGSTSQYIRGDGSLATRDWINSDSLAVRRSGSYPGLLAHITSWDAAGTGGTAGGVGPDSANILIGNENAAGMTSGYRNVGLGNDATKRISTGFDNLGIGGGAFGTGAGNVTGSQNLSLAAGGNFTSLTSGVKNIAIGGTILTGITTTSNNIGIGAQALQSGTGTGNIGIGVTAGVSTGNGVYNVAVGEASLAAAGNKSYNTVVGYVAGGGITSGNTNTIVGYGWNTLSSGSSNLGLGNTSGGSMGFASNTGNYQVNIANWLYKNSNGYASLNGVATPSSAPTITTGLVLDIVSTIGGFRSPVMTTAQRNALTGVSGSRIANSGINKDQYHNGTVWTTDATIFTQTADKNINTTAAETTLFGTGSGTLTIPADYLYSGNTITIKVQGYMTTNGTPTLDIKFKLGSTTITSTGATTLVAVGSNGYFEATCTLTARASPGASAAVMGQGKFDYYSAAVTMNSISAMSTATVNTATNGSLVIDVTATWGTSDAANKIVSTNAYVQLKN